jgi:uncharacterized protein (TIGR02099 family)
MSKSPAFILLWNSLRWLARAALWLVFGGVMLLVVLILALRYVVLPNIEDHHSQITASVSQLIAAPVMIGSIHADWDGFAPHLTLLDVKVLDPQRHAALVLPEINVRVSWWSIPTLQLRLAWLEINHAELHIQRNPQGKIFVGGIALAEQGNNSEMSDWLLHQSDIVISDAKIVWQDDKRAAPALVLNAVDLHIASTFGHHRFALHAATSPHLSSPLDVRGDFYGHSFGQLKSWRGELFTQLEYADITAWRPWFNLPPEFSQGRGGLRGWLQIANGKITHLTGDLAVKDVVTKLSADVPAMVLHSLHGRATWKDLGGGFEINTQKLTMQLNNGVTLPTTDLLVRIIDGKNERPAQGEMRANVLHLETLVSLANFIPLPKEWRAQLDGFAPQGKVSALDVSWSGNGKLPQHFKVKGQFEHFGLAQFGQLPGFKNLTADIDGDDLAGHLQVHAYQLQIDAPLILREPIALDTFTMLLNWQHGEQEWAIEVPRLTAENADLAGNAALIYRSARNSPGILDLTVKLKRADASKVARYTPLFAINRVASDWLATAIQAGHSEDFYLRIKGNLNDFPFEHNGIFELSAAVENGAIQFSSDWPKVEKIKGNLLLSGKQLAFNTLEASMLGVPTQSVSVQLPDLMVDKVALVVKVDAQADTHDFLRLVHDSPVRGYVQGFTDRIAAKGLGQLDLYVRVPEVGKPQAEVRGTYVIKNNEADLGGQVPVMRHLSGELSFTESELHTRDVSAEILGGSAVLDIQTQKNGGVRAQVNGNTRTDTLRNLYPHRIWDQVQGAADWQVVVDVNNQLPHVTFDSNLTGLRMNLPVPFNKTAETALPLHIETSVTSNAPDQEIVTAQLGTILSGRLLRNSLTTQIQRGTLQFGGQGAWVDQEGIWVTGDLPELALQGWECLSGESSGGALPIAVQNLHIGNITVYGQTLHDVRLNARKRPDGYAAELESKALTGELLWQPQGTSGKLTAKLQQINWQGEPSTTNTPPTPSPASTSTFKPNMLPTIDVSVEHLQLKNKQIGKISLSGQPDGADWRLNQLSILNPDGSLTGSGIWRGNKPHTEVHALLQISDAGKVMARSGYPKTLEKGSGTLKADLAWDGTPMTFNYATLDGTLKLDTDKGRFLKIEPGIAKLLGVLSLQALPKHIALDFTDIFSEGFQFDNINGNATIQKGVMNTKDLHLNGSAAKVTMQGSVNLNQETQNLRVEILPAVGESVSLLSGFAGGPIVGVSTLILSKVMGNPFDKLVSFQYNITGGWSDPVIVKVGQTPVKVIMPPAAVPSGK